MEWIMWRTGSMTNWIQEDDFNWLHNMQGAKFGLLDSMRGAKCTIICKAESLSICWKSIVLQGKINLPVRCLLCRQTTGCMPEYFTTTGYFYKTSTIAIEFVSRQPNTVDSFRSVELACQCMEMLNKRYHIHSHQHCPSSVLCLCCPSIRVSFALQIVQSASLHSFKLVFLVSART